MFGITRPSLCVAPVSLFKELSVNIKRWFMHLDTEQIVGDCWTWETCVCCIGQPLVLGIIENLQFELKTANLCVSDI